MKNISRRNFLKGAGLTALGIVGIAGSGAYRTLGSLGISPYNSLRDSDGRLVFNPNDPLLNKERRLSLRIFDKGYLETHRYGKDPNQVMHICLPGTPDRPTPKEDWATQDVMLYIHGGGWTLFYPELYTKNHANFFASSGIPAISLGYRLMAKPPTEPSRRKVGIEDQIEDLADATERGLKELKRFGIDNPRLFLMGDSAGGHLAMMQYLLDDKIMLKVAGILSNSGIYDLNFPITPGGLVDRNLFDNYGVGKKSRRKLSILSPIDNLHLFPEKDSPKMSIISFENDWIVRQDQANRFYEMTVSKGIPITHYKFSGGGHILPDVPFKPWLEALEFNGIRESRRSFTVPPAEFLRSFYSGASMGTYFNEAIHELEKQTILNAFKDTPINLTKLVESSK